jgi:hypothetical protein
MVLAFCANCIYDHFRGIAVSRFDVVKDVMDPAWLSSPFAGISPLRALMAAIAGKLDEKRYVSAKDVPNFVAGCNGMKIVPIPDWGVRLMRKGAILLNTRINELLVNLIINELPPALGVLKIRPISHCIARGTEGMFENPDIAREWRWTAAVNRIRVVNERVRSELLTDTAPVGEVLSLDPAGSSDTQLATSVLRNGMSLNDAVAKMVPIDGPLPLQLVYGPSAIGLELVGGGPTFIAHFTSRFRRGGMNATEFHREFVELLVTVLGMVADLRVLNLLGIVHGDAHLANFISYGAVQNQYAIDFSRAVIPLVGPVFDELYPDARKPAVQGLCRAFFVRFLENFYARYKLPWNGAAAKKIVEEQYAQLTDLFAGLDLYELLDKVQTVIERQCSPENLNAEPNGKLISELLAISRKSLDLAAPGGAAVVFERLVAWFRGLKGEQFTSPSANLDAILAMRRETMAGYVKGGVRRITHTIIAGILRDAEGMFEEPQNRK